MNYLMEKLENKWIQVQGYKHDGRMHRIWDSVFVLEDNEEYISVASSKAIKIIEHDFRVWYTKEPAIMIFFKKRWFNIIAMLKDTGITYYVNLASPTLIDGLKAKYIDYDLDIKLYPNNNIRLIDTKEYDHNRKLYGYSEDIQKILVHNVHEIEEIMKKREFPFSDIKIRKYFDKYKKEAFKNEESDNYY